VAARSSPVLLDLHVHSTCSCDGMSALADQARRAVELGLAEVGFCEHADFDPRDEGYGTLDLARYDREIAAARRDVPGVALRQGVEISYQAGREQDIAAWLAGHAWDYVVASVHILEYADGWAIVSEQRTACSYFAGHSARRAYEPYFEELLRAARSGLGDVLGHFDIVKRYGTAQYGPLRPAEFEEGILSVLRAAVEAGVGIEINSSGLRQAPGEPYPGLEVLRWYREAGGELLTVGSDAHDTRHLAAGIPAALEMARAAGFRAIATFQSRTVRWMDL
jgi:histidinol-phosphatase (PHP family)